MIRHMILILAVAVVGLSFVGPAFAQTSRPELPGQPVAGATPTTLPEVPGAGQGKAIRATVVEIKGSVLARSASQGGAFKPVSKGDTLPGDTLITVGTRGQAVLAFGDNSVVALEQFSTLSISSVYETHVAGQGSSTVVTRLKLVNGSVRAGVERGRTSSDFQITTPVATLSVRGTRPIRVFYDAGTGQLWFSLGREGEITGELAGGGRTVDVQPGEGTDQNLTLTVLMAIFDRHLQLGDPWGQTLQDYLVEVTHSSATGAFGGGNPQMSQQLTQAANGGGGSHGPNTSPTPPPPTPPGDNTGGDDNFFPDDDSTAATARVKHKVRGK